jgi:hypothetical protein
MESVELAISIVYLLLKAVPLGLAVRAFLKNAQWILLFPKRKIHLNHVARLGLASEPHLASC